MPRVGRAPVVPPPVHVPREGQPAYPWPELSALPTVRLSSAHPAPLPVLVGNGWLGTSGLVSARAIQAHNPARATPAEADYSMAERIRNALVKRGLVRQVIVEAEPAPRHPLAPPLKAAAVWPCRSVGEVAPLWAWELGRVQVSGLSVAMELPWGAVWAAMLQAGEWRSAWAAVIQGCPGPPSKATLVARVGWLKETLAVAG